MKFGLYGLHKGENTAPGELARRARAAEDAGFESLWVGDHIALPPTPRTTRTTRGSRPSSRSPTSPP